MGYRRPFSRTGGEERDAEGGGVVPSPAGGGGGGGDDGDDGGGSREEDATGSDGKDCPPRGDSARPKRRRRQLWLRAVFAMIIIVEALVLYAVNEFSPVYDFEVTSVTVTAEDGTTTVRVFCCSFFFGGGAGEVLDVDTVPCVIR